jgi:hypothetical protein
MLVGALENISINAGCGASFLFGIGDFPSQGV